MQEAGTQTLTRGQAEGERKPGRREQKARRILLAAMRHFAKSGYHAARVEDIAAELSIAKGSVFQHFGSKEALFLAAYREAVASLAKYLDAPADVLARGFFATVRYWLERTEGRLRENWVPYRLSLIGNYASDLEVRREINKFLVAEDPYGAIPFVRMGVERGEVRSDVDPELVASILEWTVERFQDALLTEELDPGLLRQARGRPDRIEARREQFLKVLESALAARSAPPRGRRRPGPVRGARRRRSKDGDA
jgi:TetR/AcrR family fatty acid metabolism transcriptional regulator